MAAVNRIVPCVISDRNGYHFYVNNFIHLRSFIMKNYRYYSHVYDNCRMNENECEGNPFHDDIVSEPRNYKQSSLADDPPASSFMEYSEYDVECPDDDKYNEETFDGVSPESMSQTDHFFDFIPRHHSAHQKNNYHSVHMTNNGHLMLCDAALGPRRISNSMQDERNILSNISVDSPFVAILVKVPPEFYIEEDRRHEFINVISANCVRDELKNAVMVPSKLPGEYLSSAKGQQTL